MSYANDGLREHTLAAAADLNTATDITGATWAPGFQNYYVRGVAAVMANTPGGTGAVIFDLRVTAGSDTGRVAGSVATLNLLAAHVQGTVVYKMNLNVLVKVGQEVIAKVSSATSAGNLARLLLFIEPDPETPGNLPKMVAST